MARTAKKAATSSPAKKAATARTVRKTTAKKAPAPKASFNPSKGPVPRSITKVRPDARGVTTTKTTRVDVPTIYSSTDAGVRRERGEQLPGPPRSPIPQIVNRSDRGIRAHAGTRLQDPATTNYDVVRTRVEPGGKPSPGIKKGAGTTYGPTVDYTKYTVQTPAARRGMSKYVSDTSVAGGGLATNVRARKSMRSVTKRGATTRASRAAAAKRARGPGSDRRYGPK